MSSVLHNQSDTKSYKSLSLAIVEFALPDVEKGYLETKLSEAGAGEGSSRHCPSPR
jgi:hypothetical protein